ncbi:aldolase [Paracoccus sediminis]|uniref:Aldolase n=1 Tax=Paracoccus sediminis TaxID=1214787 RepID=A0A238XSD6_9RHOB|nr:aldolase/citrate lyase family protein [Paracoccus sediminis]TBN47871.1 aldolase [Paracoccus sediminis]SNR61905.1 2-keto-3-deoxy-L-rhamnonate aldolase RhmA [Paracoccus sediminis]
MTGTSLRARIRAGETVVGTFVKTPAPHVVEILGLAGLDFAVADQEHAPIGLAQMDMLAMAARASGLPLLSRRWGARPDWIAPLLDLGCAGVMVPHVADRATAEAVCAAAKFDRGSRGISPSPRAGGYGSLGLLDYRRRCDEDSVVMVQIEDAPALNRLDDIAACRDVDVLFVGPADLSQSLRVGFPSPELDAAILRVTQAARRARVATGLFVGDETQIPVWQERGVTVFVCGSDQSLLMKGARRLMTTRQA